MGEWIVYMAVSAIVAIMMYGKKKLFD